MTTIEQYLEKNHPEILKEWTEFHTNEEIKTKEAEALEKEQKRQIAIQNRKPLFTYEFYFSYHEYGWNKSTYENFWSLEEAFEYITDYQVSYDKKSGYISFDEFIKESDYKHEEKFFREWLDNIHARSDEIVDKIQDRFDCQLEEEDGLGECGCTYVYTDDEIRDIFKKCYYKKVNYDD